MGLSNPAVPVTREKKMQSTSKVQERYQSDAHVASTRECMADHIKLGNALSGWG
jgi:hypothetical protein